MRDALVIRHVAFEDLGLLADILTRFDYQPRYLEAGREALTDEALQSADIVIILGGPISANDEQDYPFLQRMRESIKRRVDAGRATLGICLGAQIIAKALDAAVKAGSTKEIGWSRLTLTDAGRGSCLRHLEDVAILHWHGETFEIPTQAEHLASTDVCMNQAFSIGHHLLALQFHPEVTAEGLESWYIGHTLELSGAGVDITKLRQESQEYAPVLKNAADAMFTEWLKQLDQ